MEEMWKNTICHGKEIWVSNLGNIKDENLNVKHQNESFRYNRFSVGNHREMTHVWVAFLFCPNPDIKPFVHHINGNRRDNRACNLMWCTQEEHNKLHGKHTCVDQLSESGELITTFPNMRTAARSFGAKQHTAISLCCAGKRRTAYGYVWRYSATE